MRVHLTHLGCRLNEAELEGWARQFQARGDGIVATWEEADLVVVNTCAVTQEAVRKSRKLLRRVKRGNPRAKLVVSGCLATLEREAFARDPEIDLVISNRQKDRLPERIVGPIPPESPVPVREPAVHALFSRGRQRAFIKVQDGCRYRCTFCVVTLARGEERSRPIPEVVETIERLTEEGVQEAVLTGVHLGGWGSDLGQSLDALIRAILRETEIPRLRLGSLEPWELTDAFWEGFQDPRLMPHLHLPMQSGADTVLRRMGRRCRTEDFARLVERARTQVPQISLTTDIIAGFPGETEAEWRQTLAFVRAMAFAQVHTFVYSPRPGTRAASLPNPVDPQVKRARSREMRELAQGLRRRALEANLGRRVPVLIEGPLSSGEPTEWFGYTPDYLPVRLRSAEEETNRIRMLELTGIHGDGIHLIARPPGGDAGAS